MTAASRVRALVPVLVAALLACAGSTRELDAQAGATPPPSVTAVGCLTQTPDAPAAPPTGHEQAAAKGLTLTRAIVQTGETRTGARSAVPGSQPSGSGTGTTDRAVPPVSRPVEQAFWLVGPKSAELLRFLGRRVELTGPIDDRLGTNPGGQVLTDAGAAAARRTATAPAEPPAVAHPSAPTRAISVTTFRVIDGSCS